MRTKRPQRDDGRIDYTRVRGRGFKALLMRAQDENDADEDTQNEESSPVSVHFLMAYWQVPL